MHESKWGEMSAESGKGDIWIIHSVMIERVVVITGAVRSMTNKLRVCKGLDKTLARNHVSLDTLPETNQARPFQLRLTIRNMSSIPRSLTQPFISKVIRNRVTTVCFFLLQST